MERNRGTSDNFFGIEHKLRQGWRFEAAAAGSPSESADQEDQEHTSRGVVVTVEGGAGSVTDRDVKAISSTLVNERRTIKLG